MSTHYDIPCPTHDEHPDYYPLTKEEITHLCHIAQNADMRTKASIQCRLCQGIVGMVCPVPSDGPVAVAETRLSKYFVTNIQWYRSDPSFIDELYEIMHLPEKETHHE